MPHCPHTDNSAKSQAHSCPHTGNSAKSLAKAILLNHWHKQFCQVTGTLLHIQETILPNHWHTMRFCQFPGTLLHILAILPNHWHTDRQFSAKSLAQAILPNQACSSRFRQFSRITGTLSSTSAQWEWQCMLHAPQLLSYSHSHPQFSVAQWGLCGLLTPSRSTKNSQWQHHGTRSQVPETGSLPMDPQ